jgi:very-short-patch-repair endonuclease
MNLAVFEFNGQAVRSTGDGRFSVYDVLVAFIDPMGRSEKGGKGINPRQRFKSITDRYPDVSAFCEMHQFPGRGQRPTPVATKKTCEKILRILGKHPGQSAVTSDNFYPRTESQVVAVLIEAFQDLSPVSQFRVHGYRVDLYLATANIAIEVDEHGHAAYPSDKDLARQKAIKAALGCSFVRFDPYAVDFNLGCVIRQIRGLL